MTIDGLGILYKTICLWWCRWCFPVSYDRCSLIELVLVQCVRRILALHWVSSRKLIDNNLQETQLLCTCYFNSLRLWILQIFHRSVYTLTQNTRKSKQKKKSLSFYGEAINWIADSLCRFTSANMNVLGPRFNMFKLHIIIYLL